MAWARRFFDDFDDNSVGVSTSPGNGAITEPVGSELVLSCSSGVHCNWDPDEHDGPIAYEEFLSHLDSLHGLLRIETRLSSLVRSTTREIAGLTVWLDRDNAYQFGWYDYNNDVYIQRLAENVQTTQYQVGDYGDPNTTAHIYRVYWNRLNRRINIVSSGIFLEPGEMGFQFSVNDGSSWVWALTQAPPFIPERFGVWFRNFTDWPAVTAGFDYLSLDEWDGVELVIDEPESPGINEVHPQPKVTIEDATSRLGQSGPVDFSQQIEGPQLLPGPVAQQPGSVGPFDTTGVEDFSTPGLPQTGEPFHGQPEWETGRRVPKPMASVEQPVFGGVVDADYLPEKDDADGAAFLEGLDVQGMVKVDTTQGSFGNPTGGGHYGAARDGKHYWDDTECAPGSFGTLALGPNRTAWPVFNGASQPLGTPPPTGLTIGLTADDTVRLQGTNIDAWEGVGLSSAMGWMLTGDFDIQVDFADWTTSGGTDGGLHFQCNIDTNYGFYVRCRGNGKRYDKDVKVNGSYVSYAFVSTTDSSGKIRLVRSGTVVSQYYWTGSAWAQIGSSHDMGVSGPMTVHFSMSATGNMTYDIKISNFIITSGSTSNRTKWYLESSGDHRGTRQDMPTNMGVITTDNSLDLIDLDNDKLWMRFQQGTNNVLGATTAGTRTLRAAWDNGLLFVAYGNPTGSSGGAGLWIDFTWDRIRWHRTQADATTGGYYFYVGRQAGVIDQRNAAKGYSQDDDDWRIPDYRVNDVAIARGAGRVEYRAVATAAGMAVFKETRWDAPADAEYSLSNETGYMRWCLFDPSDQTLFYMDDTKVYSEPRATGWEAAMTGGTFTADANKDLPGTRKFPAQYTAVRYGSYLFVPAAEGVYRVDWPSGSWTLFYGKVGSGATHEILNPYDLVHTIALGNDGTLDLLAVATARKYAGQVTLVRLDTNVVYGLSRVEDLKICNAVAA